MLSILRKAGISIVLLCCLTAGRAHAIIDTGPAINGTPSQFAIYALEDIFTYTASNRETHFQEIKETYFSEKGWLEFQKNIAKTNSLLGGKHQRDVLTVYEYWSNPDKDRDDYGPNQSDLKKEEYEFSGDFLIIFMNPDDHPNDRMRVKGKYVHRPVVKIKISGVRDPVKKYGSHYIQDAPAYNYKIESIEFITRTEE